MDFNDWINKIADSNPSIEILEFKEVTMNLGKQMVFEIGETKYYAFVFYNETMN